MVRRERSLRIDSYLAGGSKIGPQHPPVGEFRPRDELEVDREVQQGDDVCETFVQRHNHVALCRVDVLEPSYLQVDAQHTHRKACPGSFGAMAKLRRTQPAGEAEGRGAEDQQHRCCEQGARHVTPLSDGESATREVVKSIKTRHDTSTAAAPGYIP